MRVQNMPSLCLMALLLFGLSASSTRANEKYTFDKDHTSIFFSVSRFGFLEIGGEFSEYDGYFVFYADHPEKDKIAITFYPAGIHTADEETDATLQGPKFFNATQFPQMRFVSTKITPTDKDNALITGNLTLLDVTKPVTLNAHFAKIDEDQNDEGDYAVRFSATGIIQRSDFGMDYMIPIIGDEVRLRIQVQGIRYQAKNPLKKE